VTTSEYSKRLGSITTKQFQVALDHFNLGQFISAKAIPFGLFGQNVFLTSTAGEFVLRGAAHYAWQFPEEQFVAKLLHDKTNAPVSWP
jgi:hygromycin-B 7''-O-kinase